MGRVHRLPAAVVVSDGEPFHAISDPPVLGFQPLRPQDAGDLQRIPRPEIDGCGLAGSHPNVDHLVGTRRWVVDAGAGVRDEEKLRLADSALIERELLQRHQVAVDAHRPGAEKLVPFPRPTLAGVLEE